MMLHFRYNQLWPWLEASAILAWGILLLKYWLTGQLNILIHPNYFGLTVIAAISLMIIGGIKMNQLIRQNRRNHPKANSQPVQHITRFPPAWGSAILLITALLGLMVAPRTFASQTALERGITESLPLTRSQPKEFRSATKPENRSLVEWVRTLNVYPEPDAYTGQKVKVQGFVIYPPSLPEQYLWVARFIITCCAADAYPVGLPVKLTQGSRAAFPADSWIEVEGQMITENFGEQRKLAISATSIKPISEPKNPYDY